MAAKMAAKSVQKTGQNRYQVDTAALQQLLAENNDLLIDRAARRREDAFMAKARKPAPVSTHGRKDDGWNLVPDRCADCRCTLMVPVVPHRRDLYCIDCWRDLQVRHVNHWRRLKPAQVQWLRWFVAVVRP